VPAAAPRYDPRLIAAARKLDDDRLPIAETCRRVGDAADRLGLTRPSYVHLRRIVKAERERRAELRALAADVVGDFAGGRVPRLEVVVERAREANLRAERRRRS
jgi:hypothetical protein